MNDVIQEIEGALELLREEQKAKAGTAALLQRELAVAITQLEIGLLCLKAAAGLVP